MSEPRRTPKTGPKSARARNLRKVPKNVRRSERSAAKARSRGGMKRGVIIAALMLATGFTGWGGYLGYDQLIKSGWFTLTNVEIRGVATLSEARILARLNLPQGIPLPQVDLDAVAASVLSHPWVGRAQVRRLYPDTLLVRIWERQPAAMLIEREDNSAQMVDTEGVVLGPPTTAHPDLVRLTGISLKGLVTGDRVDGKRVRLGIQVANAYHGATPLVDVADPTDPLLLADGMRIRLGDRGGYDWRLERLERLRGELTTMGGDKGTEVDLRFRDRLIARPLG